MPVQPRKCRRCGVAHRSASAAENCRERSARRTKKRKAYKGRADRIYNTYGITLIEYASILAAQGGRCAGCGGTRTYNLHVDHDHNVERKLLAQGVRPQNAARFSIRALLCRNCNGVLRKVRDNSSTLASLAEIVDTFPAQDVLTYSKYDEDQERGNEV